MCAVIMNKEICIAVATHKPYRMPADLMYLPLHVGKALHPDTDLGPSFAVDNAGENISNFNATYSELTGLYWMWKNCDANYKGLVHYRRHFGTTHIGTRLFAKDRFRRILTQKDLESLLHVSCATGSAPEIILPKKRHYYIETVYSHYSHTFDGKQFDEARNVIGEMHPKYVAAFDQLMQSRSAHIFNMFIMTRERFDEYCAWMFPIIEELTRRIPPETYDAFGARYPGRVSERLLDVWINTSGYAYVELPVVSPEPVDWWSKGTGFLKAKFIGKHYEKSF